MAFANYEQLKAAVAERRKSILTIEVDLGGSYSQEYEDAKKELAQAKGMKALMGGVPFMGDTNVEELEARVASLRPEANSVFVQYRQLDLATWAMLLKKTGMSALEQYESVLAQTFIGVFGEDPDKRDEDGNPIPVEPLSTSAALMSSKGDEGILPGGALHSVVSAFMAWQNNGGDVNIRPTKSGLV